MQRNHDAEFNITIGKIMGTPTPRRRAVQARGVRPDQRPTIHSVRSVLRTGPQTMPLLFAIKWCDAMGVRDRARRRRVPEPKRAPIVGLIQQIHFSTNLKSLLPP